jgi:hypothetical protein
MTTIASCGHSVDFDDELVQCALARYDRLDDRCIHYGSYCKSCYEREQKEGNVLYTELDEKEWIENEPR